MNRIRITAIRQTVYPDLMEKYENPIEHTCNVKEGQQWISENGECPEKMCPAAWYSMREFYPRDLAISAIMRTFAVAKLKEKNDI